MQWLSVCHMCPLANCSPDWMICLWASLRPSLNDVCVLGTIVWAHKVQFVGLKCLAGNVSTSLCFGWQTPLFAAFCHRRARAICMLFVWSAVLLPARRADIESQFHLMSYLLCPLLLLLLDLKCGQSLQFRSLCPRPLPHCGAHLHLAVDLLCSPMTTVRSFSVRLLACASYHRCCHKFTILLRLLVDQLNLPHKGVNLHANTDINVLSCSLLLWHIDLA